MYRVEFVDGRVKSYRDGLIRCRDRKIKRKWKWMRIPALFLMQRAVCRKPIAAASGRLSLSGKRQYHLAVFPPLVSTGADHLICTASRLPR